MTKPTKAWWRGLGSVMQIAPSGLHRPVAATDADAARLRADFARIGRDMHEVLAPFNRARPGETFCPHCGAGVCDPFGLGRVIHDVAACRANADLPG